MKLLLKPGNDARLRGGHPWVYRTEIASLPETSPGTTIPFQSSTGEILAWGYANEQSMITGRAFHFEKEPPPKNWLEQKLKLALSYRLRYYKARVYRLAFSEGDGIPGLIIDRYNDLCVVQETTAGIEARRGEWLEALKKIIKPKWIYLRNESPIRQKEGLARESLWLTDPAPEAGINVKIAGAEFLINPAVGHKSGFYLDQQLNYEAWQRWIKPGDHLLDLFCYQGGFSLAGVQAGAARATAVDSSGPALAHARANAEKNGVAEKLKFVESDVVQFLQADDNLYDLISLDPPPMAKSAPQLRLAFGKYLQLHKAAMKKLKPGGLLFTYSCSEAVEWESLTKIIKSAAQQAGRRATILQRLSQPPDHPFGAAFPEGEYLRGFVVGVE
jgi:23S rRNA (cytosine1962-C5)-methyltransferase